MLLNPQCQRIAIAGYGALATLSVRSPKFSYESPGTDRPPLPSSKIILAGLFSECSADRQRLALPPSRDAL